MLSPTPEPIPPLNPSGASRRPPAPPQCPIPKTQSSGFITFAAFDPPRSPAFPRRKTEQTFFIELNRFAVLVFEVAP